MIFDEGTLAQCRALLLRWNKAASAAGSIGSEYIDDPERVFDHQKALNRMLEKRGHRFGTLGIPLPTRDLESSTLALDAAMDALEFLVKNCTAESFSPWSEALSKARAALKLMKE